MLAERRSLPAETRKERPNECAAYIYLRDHDACNMPSPSRAQVRVLISGGFSAAYQELVFGPRLVSHRGFDAHVRLLNSKGRSSPAHSTELRNFISDGRGASRSCSGTSGRP